MKCNYCQKDIEKGKGIKVKRALHTTDRATGRRFLSFAIYHQECWQVIRQNQKTRRKWFWIFIIITIFFLSTWVFWTFYQVGK